MMSEANQHGQFYYYVKMSEREEMYVFADQVEVSGGALLFKGKDHQINFAFAAGQWEQFCAVSYQTGQPVAVEHWIENVDDTPTPKGIGFNHSK